MNSIISSRLPVPASEAPLLAMLLTNRVCAGFPSPAEDLGAQLSAPTELAPYAWSAQEISASSPIRFAIALKSDNRLVGTAGFHTVSPVNQTAELAYDLIPDIWGRGIATAVCEEARFACNFMMCERASSDVAAMVQS